MHKAHKIRLNPTSGQAQQFMRAAGVARFTWNTMLADYKRVKDAGEKVDWNLLKKGFRARIDDEYPFVREVTKCATEEAIADLRQTISTYHQAKRKDPALCFPGLRKRSKKIGGFGLANDKFRVNGNEARLPKVGMVNMAEPLRFEGKILNGRVNEEAGRWYLVIVVDVEAREPEATPGAVGIDFGLAHFATLSNGEVVETQGHLRRAEEKVRRINRGLSRKQKGSSNRRKWKLRLARAHARVRNQRHDFLHKFTSGVTARYGTVCVEDLNLKGLCRTRLSKSFHDAGLGEAIRQLGYKQEWQGGELRRVDRFFPSSKRCHVCGWLHAGLTLGVRHWRCFGCGAEHDRDENAAVNIYLEGLGLPAGSGYVGVTPVEGPALAREARARVKLAPAKQVLQGVLFAS